MAHVFTYCFAFVVLITASTLFFLGYAMRNDKLKPNSFAGIRTKPALKSHADWYKIQRAGSVSITCLGVAYLDSSALFLVQAIYHELIPEILPVLLIVTQTAIGITAIYLNTSKSAISDK